MASSEHQRAIAEVSDWLEFRELSEFIYTLIENGYDDLDAISQCLPNELKELEDVFHTPHSKANIRLLVETLQQVGIVNYRKSRRDFLRLLEEAATKLPATARRQSETNVQTTSISSPLVVEDTTIPDNLVSPSKGSFLGSSGSGRRGKKAKSLEGYFSIQTDRIATGKWVDKYVMVDVESSSLSWLLSKKEGVVDQSIDLKDVTAVDQTDLQTVRVTLNQGFIELWGTHANKWIPSLSIYLGRNSMAETKAPADSDLASEDGDIPASASTIKPSRGSEHKEDDDEDESESESEVDESDSDDSDVGGAPVTPSSILGDESKKVKIDTWEEAIAFQATERAKHICAQMYPFHAAPPAPPVRAMSANETKLVEIFRPLKAGDIFKKHKRGSSSKRRIFITELLDYLCWGDVDNKSLTKGFVRTEEIQELNQGFGANRNRIYVVTKERTLELEAGSTLQANKWRTGLELLMKYQKISDGKKQEILNSPDWKQSVKAYTEEHRTCLVAGDVFKKWPTGQKVAFLGKFTCRRIWAAPTLDRINWSETGQTKVRGFLLLDDMFEIWEEPNDKTKFTIKARGKSLDLEAKSGAVRDKWIRALRFFAESRKEQAKKSPSPSLPHRKSS